MKVTIKEVAKEAKVATSTVSRVISNSSRISEETKRKVNEAIKKLNYTPNAMARGLVNNKSKILGVVLPNEAQDLFSNPFFVEGMRGMSIAAEENGYYIMYAFSKNAEDELKNVKDFASNNLLDGICLLTSRENDKCIEYLKNLEFPFVVIGEPDRHKDILWVDNDNVKAMYTVVNNLIKSGFKNIGFIGGKKNWKVSKNRLKGYLEGLKDNNIEINEKIIIEKETFTEECGYKAIVEIIKEDIPEAIVTTEDLLAVGVGKYLKEHNIEGVKIIGFNNTPIVKYSDFKIDTIDINACELGYEGAKLLIDSLNKKEIKKNYRIIETKMIEK